MARATVYELCAKGRLGHARVGLSTRISERQVDAFLSAHGSSAP